MCLLLWRTAHELSEVPQLQAQRRHPKLAPITEVGGGGVYEKQTAYSTEIIKKVNELFEGELTEQDKLVYVNNVIKGKRLESETLKQQATNNTKEQFANSPDLKTEILNAVRKIRCPSHGIDDLTVIAASRPWAVPPVAWLLKSNGSGGKEKGRSEA